MIESEFKPTYLMIKQHKVTGLKYFCKTIKKCPYKYNGSGIFWKRHINKHGKNNVETLWCHLFTDVNDLTEFATFFSEVFNIVESKEWANLVVENGLTGFSSHLSKEIQHKLIVDGTHHLLNGNIQRDYQKSKVSDGTHRWLSGNEQRDVQNRLVKDGVHRFCDSSYQSKVSKLGNAKRIKDGTHNAIQSYVCPHCNKVGKGMVMFRHHYDNCKHKSC